MRAILALAILFAAPALAQDRNQTLADIRQELSVLYVEMQKLRRELSTTGGVGTNISGTNALERLDAMEAEVRRLTAANELLQNRVDSITRDGTNRIGDLEFRLCELETACDIASLGETTTLGGGALPAATATATTSIEAPLPATGGEIDTGDIASGIVDTGGMELAHAERADFDRAKASFDEGAYQNAADQFQRFTETYQGGPLTGLAHLMRGESLSKLGMTSSAARAFLESYSGTPNGPHGADGFVEAWRLAWRVGPDGRGLHHPWRGHRAVPLVGRLDRGSGRAGWHGLFVTATPPKAISEFYAYWARGKDRRLGVAVSGGSDSLALLHLLNDWGGAELFAATVDHGLREAAAGEARQVAAICTALGIPHETLTWNKWDCVGNVQAAARKARYSLLADWAKSKDCDAVALGHTEDDQAETFLMRLAREAGVTGLANMDARFERDGVFFHRPLLNVSRADLQADLRRRNVAWIDDPTNDDATFERSKARKALQVLAPLGVTTSGLARVSRQLGDAEAALVLAAEDWARDPSHLRYEAADVVLNRRALAGLPRELMRRILSATLQYVAGARHGPRRQPLDDAMQSVNSASNTTLHGCRILSTDDRIWVTRELAAVAGLEGPTSEIWDNRWLVEGPHDAALHVAALGEAVSACENWRDTGFPRAALMSSPAIWRGQDLIAAPLAGFSMGWQARLVRPRPFVDDLVFPSETG